MDVFKKVLKGDDNMSLMTRRSFMDLLSRIMQTGGMTEDMENDLAKIRDDFDEREGILKRYGETYDGEDRDEYEWKERDGSSIYQAGPDEKDWKKEYDNLQDRYLKRFFGVLPETEKTREEEYQVDDTVVESEEPKTLDDLIYESED